MLLFLIAYANFASVSIFTNRCTLALGAYSPTHNVILSVGAGRYIGPEPVAQLYRFSDNTWHATEPPPFRADDSQSMIVYAPTIERFVLIHPVENFGSSAEFVGEIVMF